MTQAGEKQTLHWYLRNARGVLLWKLQGLPDYDSRRPMTPTGTNLLGLVKHCAGVECGYFGQVMGRPFPGQGDLDWDDDELDGAAGLREGVSNMPSEAGAAAWKQHYDKLDQIARSGR